MVAAFVALVARLLRQDQGAPPSVDTAEPGSVRQATGAVERSKPAITAAPAGGPSGTTQAGPETATGAAWVAPAEGICPASHPVKAKESSGIFHVPGGVAYERTVPDRCYLDVAAAEADGYRQSKR